jgi:hypothetical protein
MNAFLSKAQKRILLLWLHHRYIACLFTEPDFLINLMKRIEFLRTAILAAIYTPELLPKIFDQPKNVSKLEEAIVFKVNDTILKDSQLFNLAINGLVVDRNIQRIDIGRADDDFVMGFKTVKITFV